MFSAIHHNSMSHQEGLLLVVDTLTERGKHEGAMMVEEERGHSQKQ